MTDRTQDESLMIDYLLGELDDEQGEALKKRLLLPEETQLRALYEDLARTFAAMNKLPEPELPDNLVEKTLNRIAAAKRINALLALQQMNTGRFRSRFSLRELAAVAAIVLVAIGILLPSLQVARSRGQRGLCAARMGQIGSAMQAHATNNDDRLPNAAGVATHWLPAENRRTTSNSSALFKLLRQRYVTDPTVFQCPAVGGDSFAMRDDLRDFPQQHHISYSYQHSLGDDRLHIRAPNVVIVASSMVILADQTPIFTDGKFHPEHVSSPVSANHGRAGQNVLFIDGHVIWSDHANVGVDGDNIYLAGDVVEYVGNEVPEDTTDTFLLPAWVRR